MLPSSSVRKYMLEFLVLVYRQFHQASPRDLGPSYGLSHYLPPGACRHRKGLLATPALSILMYSWPDLISLSPFVLLVCPSCFSALMALLPSACLTSSVPEHGCPPLKPPGRAGTGPGGADQDCLCPWPSPASRLVAVNRCSRTTSAQFLPIDQLSVLLQT